MLMFLFNVFCLFSYFGVCLVVIFALYYFRVLDNKTPVRYQYNPIDFVLDCIKIISFDLQNTSPDDFTQSGIVIHENYLNLNYQWQKLLEIYIVKVKHHEPLKEFYRNLVYPHK